jgi:aspartyl-tRNA(Asn)/glutamyl-tRNA(Gln) amidotransferase subunit B
MNNKYEAVIGLEVHSQLLTKSKAFCSCSTSFGAIPNTNTCPICLGHPGTLPQLNKNLVEYIVKMGLATHCSIREKSYFARKNYFYADLVKGYQITQDTTPICYNGYLEIELGDNTSSERKKIGITRIHMEEDTGKAIHDLDIDTLLDYNRSGVPLIEIVSEPDIRNANEAYKYLTELKRILVYLGICTGNMEEGALRCDANVSVRLVGSEKFGTKTEVKNMNSFRNVEKAIDYEINRQIELLESGGKVVQETRMWDGQHQITKTMRTKETAADYRYFSEPDLLPVIVDKKWQDSIRATLVELPLARKDRFCKQYSIPIYDAGILVEEQSVANYYEAVCSKLSQQNANLYKLVSNWLMTEVLHILSERSISIDELNLKPELVAELVELFASDTISSRVAKDIFPEVLAKGTSPKIIIERDGLSQVSDTSAIEEIVKKIIADNSESVEKYKSGRTNVLGFFVGQTMKSSGGKANPKIVTEIVSRYLNE